MQISSVKSQFRMNCRAGGVVCMLNGIFLMLYKLLISIISAAAAPATATPAATTTTALGKYNRRWWPVRYKRMK